MATRTYRATKPRLRTSDGQRYPVTVTTTKRRIDPEAWKAALEAVDGDRGRLQVEEDGTITVMNKSRSPVR